MIMKKNSFKRKNDIFSTIGTKARTKIKNIQ